MTTGVVLLDVNVLIALTWVEHVHHGDARRWFLARKPQPWATCPITECGYLRITANARRTQAAGDLRQTTESLRLLRAFPRHQFWPDDVSPVDGHLFEQLAGHRQVTDAYLLMLAVRQDGVLATFDSGIRTLAQNLLNDPDRVELIPVAPAA